jgi:hypothetical protein
MIHFKVAEAFEQKIHRIHELLEGSGADVTWNDHIPDPDNPIQARQIDVTVRRDETLTMIECRDRREPQDVTWIEELIGRRASLKADAAIAVSSSGFTAGALSKAKQFDIICRHFFELTNLEIDAWGRRVALTLYFYEYSDLKLLLCLQRESLARLNGDVVKSELDRHPCMQSLFNAAAKQLDTLNMIGEECPGQPVKFRIRLEFEGFQVSGEPIIQVEFCGYARLVSEEIISKAVLSYRAPGEPHKQPVVENFALGQTSIVYDDERISVLVDLSELNTAPFCQFRFLKLTGRDELAHEALELVGIDKLQVQAKMAVDFASL